MSTELPEENPLAIPDWDVIIVGGGPAGLTAALMLGRYRRRTLLFDDGRPRNAVTKGINGIAGLQGLTAREFQERAGREIDAYPDVHRRDERITAAWRDDQGWFIVATASGGRARARRILLATGVEDLCPSDIDGFWAFYGTSIHHCPDCDGYDARDKRLGILSWGKEAAPYALEFLNWTTDLTLLTNGHSETIPAPHVARLQQLRIPIDPRPIARFEGSRGEIRSVRFADGSREPFQAVFFHLGQRPRSELARQLGCILDEHGHVEQDRRQRTSVDGVFAAGDIAPPDETVAVAIAQGQVAAIVINHSLYPPERHLE